MCGVFGAFSTKGHAVLEDIYLGLYALQHRGQESAGIAWIEHEKHKPELHSIKGMGLVHNAIDQSKLSEIKATSAIGHVRYSTFGDSLLQNAQPLAANYAKGPVAIAHNGNITNADGLIGFLENRGAIMHSSCDSEVILHLMAHQSHQSPLDSLLNALRQLEGAYSLTVLFEDKLVAARDPWGFRPLALGVRDDVYYVASESCAFDMVGASFVRDIKPGEVLIIDEKGPRGIQIPVTAQKGYLCSFEYVYFARPDSVIDGISVYNARKEMGRRLARTCPFHGSKAGKNTVVTGMPDSGTIAALGFSEAAELPFEIGVVRNRYVGRTFIQPTQRVREIGVRIKLNPIEEVFSGKDAVVIDDSIVRGTTASRIVSMVKDAGAQSVNLRIASPPVRFPCYYGIDTPSTEELAAACMDLETLRKEVGATSLAYLAEDELIAAIGLPKERLCTACFSGDYPKTADDCCHK